MKIAFIDTETGGIGIDAARKYSILQLGCVVYDTTNPGGAPEYQCYINERLAPGVDGLFLDSQAMAINKISPETIDTLGLSPMLAVVQFLRFLTKQFPQSAPVYPGSEFKPSGDLIVLGGHNAGYDAQFLHRLFRLAGVGELFDQTFSHRLVDTASIARFLIDAGIIGVQKNTTETLFEFFDVKPVKAHDALCDARSTAQLYEKMISILHARAAFPSVVPIAPDTDALGRRVCRL